MDVLDGTLKGEDAALTSTLKSAATTLRPRGGPEWHTLKVTVTSPQLSDDGFTLYRVNVTDRTGGVVVQCVWRRFRDCEEVFSRLCDMQVGRDGSPMSPRPVSPRPVSPADTSPSTPPPTTPRASAFFASVRSASTPFFASLASTTTNLSASISFMPTLGTVPPLYAKFSGVFAKTKIGRFSKATIEKRRAGIQEFLQFVIDEAARESEECNVLPMMTSSTRKLSGGSVASSVSIAASRATSIASTCTLRGRRDATYLEMSNSYLFLNLLGLATSGPGSGWLSKMGEKTLGMRATFKRRWFEVNPSYPYELVYSERRNSRRRRGQILLTHGVSILDQESNRYPHSFCIAGPDLPRTYLLMAETEEAKKEWVAFLTDTVKRNAAAQGAEGMQEEGWIPEEDDEEAAPNLTMTDLLHSCPQGGGGGGAAGDLAVKTDIRLRDFRVLCIVGIGSFGRVMKVLKKNKATSEKEVFAMKVIEKDQVIKNRMVHHAISEKEILEQIGHPFIVQLHHSFQTRRHLIFVMDFLSGGELYFHLQREKRFSAQRARIYTAEIALAISHLHGMDVIYRDLKSENLVLDKDGHVILTDFGLAKVKVDHQSMSHTFCGTPEYMAPELVQKKGHGFKVDWWSLGILLHEMLTGIPPFTAKTIPDMYHAILNQPLVMGDGVHPDAAKVIPQLLDRNPETRLGSVTRLQKQAFFRELNFGDVMQKRIPMPWVPDVQDDLNDTRYFSRDFTAQTPELLQAGKGSYDTSRFAGFAAVA